MNSPVAVPPLAVSIVTSMSKESSPLLAASRTKTDAGPLASFTSLVGGNNSNMATAEQ